MTGIPEPKIKNRPFERYEEIKTAEDYIANYITLTQTMTWTSKTTQHKTQPKPPIKHGINTHKTNVQQKYIMNKKKRNRKMGEDFKKK